MGQEEKRKFARLQTRLLTFVKLRASGKVLRAMTRDVGEKGACLVMDDALQQDTQVSLEMQLPDYKVPLPITARVAWSRYVVVSKGDAEHLTIETGVEFLTIDPNDHKRLMQYVKLNAIPDSF